MRHSIIYSYLDWKWSSVLLESWEGLLLVTDVSTTCAEAIFRVSWLWRLTQLWRWLLHRLSKRQSPATGLLRTPITQIIIFNQGMILLGSNHFLAIYSSHHIDPSFHVRRIGKKRRLDYVATILDVVYQCKLEIACKLRKQQIGK